MADVKAAVAAATAKPVAKAVVATKTTEVKEEVKKAEVKKAAPAKKAEAKAPAKKAEAKAPAAKKAPAKKAEAKAPAAKKAAPAKTVVKETINFQFAGKEYKTEDFVKIAKDVWQYDLGNKVADFKAVELYVKPEESMVYYVINGDVTGSFAI